MGLFWVNTHFEENQSNPTLFNAVKTLVNVFYMHKLKNGEAILFCLSSRYWNQRT